MYTYVKTQQHELEQTKEPPTSGGKHRSKEVQTRVLVSVCVWVRLRFWVETFTNDVK